MANQVTITAKTGPGVTDTAIVIRDVTRVDYDFTGQTVSIYRAGVPNPLIYDLGGVTTITTTISGTTYTLTIS